MAKKMKLMVIRRKLSTGLLVGGIKVVDCQEKWGVYAHDIPQNALGSIYYTNGTFEEVPSVELLVPQKTLDDLKKYHYFNVEHPINKSWAEVLAKQTKIFGTLPNTYFRIAKLYSRSGHYILISEPFFRKVTYKGKISVRVSFTRILEIC